MAKEEPNPDAVLNQLFDSLIDPILCIDARGIVHRINQSTIDTFGYPARELLGQNVKLLMAEPYRSAHDGYIANYFATGEERAIGRVRQVNARHKDGREFPCELSVSRVEAPEGIRFYGIVRDVSEREGILERVAQVERLAAVGELAAGVAHEINNPVNTIINCAKLVKDGDDDPQLVDDIIDEGLRIAMIVRDLLDLSREQSRDGELVETAEVLRRVINLLSTRMSKDGITIDLELDPELGRIRGRSHQIQQVLMNLTLNARDALLTTERAEKRIRIVARNAGEHDIEIRVRDNGPGIVEHDLERIFRPFFTKKTDRGGTGLGLSVSRSIIQAHEGSIAAHSSVGEYAEFVVLLPRDAGAGS